MVLVHLVTVAQQVLQAPLLPSVHAVNIAWVELAAVRTAQRVSTATLQGCRLDLAVACVPLVDTAPHPGSPMRRAQVPVPRGTVVQRDPSHQQHFYVLWEGTACRALNPVSYVHQGCMVQRRDYQPHHARVLVVQVHMDRRQA